MIASFLVSELEEFMEDLPDVGSKLMRMLGRMALSKQASNLRDELADKVTPALDGFACVEPVPWGLEERPRLRGIEGGHDVVLGGFAVAQ